MSSFPSETPGVLADAIEAARRVLRELDDEALPASLRKVAASTSGRLPPPLARSLVAELDGNEWLRAKVLEDFSGDAVSRSYLAREQGWWAVLAEAVAATRSEASATGRRELEARVDGLTADLATAKKKLKTAKRAAEAAAAAGKEEARSGRHRLQEAVARTTAALDQAENERDSTARLLGNARRDLEGAGTELDALRARLRLQRKDLARLRASQRAGETLVQRDALELSKQLDHMAAVIPVRRFEETAVPAEALKAEEAPPSGTIEPPPGVAPDSAEMIEWLHRQPTPCALLVDGHNLLFQLDRSTATTASARRRLIEDLARFKSSSAADHDVVVVFDSHLPGTREAELRNGVELVYAEAGIPADDVIIAMVAEFGRPVVVVSSDRAVREGTEAAGALALWAEALRDWLR